MLTSVGSLQRCVRQSPQETCFDRLSLFAFRELQRLEQLWLQNLVLFLNQLLKQMACEPGNMTRMFDKYSEGGSTLGLGTGFGVRLHRTAVNFGRPRCAKGA